MCFDFVMDLNLTKVHYFLIILNVTRTVFNGSFRLHLIVPRTKRLYQSIELTDKQVRIRVSGLI